MLIYNEPPIFDPLFAIIKPLMKKKLRDRVKYLSGPGCSKLTTSLVNVLLKFQMLISEI